MLLYFNGMASPISRHTQHYKLLFMAYMLQDRKPSKYLFYHVLLGPALNQFSNQTPMIGPSPDMEWNMPRQLDRVEMKHIKSESGMTHGDIFSRQYSWNCPQTLIACICRPLKTSFDSPVYICQAMDQYFSFIWSKHQCLETIFVSALYMDIQF